MHNRKKCQAWTPARGFGGHCLSSPETARAVSWRRLVTAEYIDDEAGNKHQAQGIGGDDKTSVVGVPVHQASPLRAISRLRNFRAVISLRMDMR